MDDPFMNAISPTDVAELTLQKKQLELSDFALSAVATLRGKGFPKACRVLVDRGERKTMAIKQGLLKKVTGEQIIYSPTQGWSLTYSSIREPHLRMIYLLVDGEFAIDALGDRKKYRDNLSNAWVKVEPREHPTLVPFATNQIASIDECDLITRQLWYRLIASKCATVALKDKFMPNL